MKCPVCGGKLDFNLKVSSATCHTCGWTRIFLTNGVRYTISKRNKVLLPKHN